MELRFIVKRTRSRNALLIAGVTIFSFTTSHFIWNSFNRREKLQAHPNESNDFHRDKLRFHNLELSEKDILRDVQKILTNFPVSFWEENKNNSLYYKNSSCARYPSLYDLKVDNIYWQILNTKRGFFYLYGAYYDGRKGDPNGPSVRLIGMIDHLVMPRTYCQMWFSGRDEPVIVHTLKNIFPRKNSGSHYFPYIVACPIPKNYGNQVPAVVSLVENVCDSATNSLKVIYNKPTGKGGKKSRIGVCVKALDFYHKDMSLRLIEWIELVRIFGAEKIYIYLGHVHENLSKVLHYYEQEGMVELVPMPLPGHQVNLVGLQHLYSYNHLNFRRENELIAYNDCIYKNIHRYEYIAVLDIDEIIVPLKVDNWMDLMRKVSTEINNTYGGYQVDMVHFPTTCDNSHEWVKDIPSYFFMMQHTLRNKTFPWWYCPKSFMNTNDVTTVNNHYAESCLTAGKCRTYRISHDDAQLNHYRIPIEDRDKSCEEMRPGFVNDTILWKWKKPLIERSLRVLNDLGFFA